MNWKKEMEENRTIIKIGDPNNAYIEDDSNCIVYKIEDDFTTNEYDQSKYALENDPEITNYTETIETATSE